MNWATLGMLILGCVAMTVGAALIYLPAGLIVLGLALSGLAIAETID